jgi:hypothetical protein
MGLRAVGDIPKQWISVLRPTSNNLDNRKTVPFENGTGFLLQVMGGRHLLCLRSRDSRSFLIMDPPLGDTLLTPKDENRSCAGNAAISSYCEFRTMDEVQTTASVVSWSEFLTANSEVPSAIPVLPNFQRSTVPGTRSYQLREHK